MFFMDEEKLLQIRKAYPKGTKVILSHISDPYISLPSGSKGVVEDVDDAGQIHIEWECGLEFALIEGIDDFTKQ